MKPTIRIGLIIGMIVCISIPIQNGKAVSSNDAIECEIYASILGLDVLKNIGFEIGIWTYNENDYPVEVTFIFSEVTCRWWEHLTSNYSAPPGEHRVTFNPGCVNGFFQLHVYYNGKVYERRGVISSGVVLLRPVIVSNLFNGDTL